MTATPESSTTPATYDPSQSSKQVWILFAIGLIAIAWVIYLTRMYLMDDTLITLRYSFNLVRYGHPVWNHADLSRQGIGFGYTSVLWMLVNAVPAVFIRNKDVLVQMSRLLAFVPLGVIVWVFAFRMEKLQGSMYAKAAVILAIFTTSLYGFHVNTGMETLLFCCLMLLAVVTSVQRPDSALPYVFGILAFLARPEGGLLVPLLCIRDLLNKRYRRAAIGAGSLALTALVLGFVMKLEYGHFLPNSFYVKQETGIVAKSFARTGYYLREIALPFIPLALISVFRVKDATARMCLCVALVFLAYYATVADIMNITYRFQMPAQVLLTFASLPAIGLILKEWRRWRTIGALVFVVALFCNFIAMKRAIWWSAVYGTDVSSFISLGKAMKPYQVNNRWLAFDWAGAIPYYSDWDTSDVIGLTDYNLASKRIKASDVMRDPSTEMVMFYREIRSPFPTEDTDRHLAELQILSPTDQRSIALKDYTIVRDLPVMINGEVSFGLLRIYARNPERAKAMLSTLTLQPVRPIGILESLD